MTILGQTPFKRGPIQDDSGFQSGADDKLQAPSLGHAEDNAPEFNRDGQFQAASHLYRGFWSSRDRPRRADARGFRRRDRRDRGTASRRYRLQSSRAHQSLDKDKLERFLGASIP